MERCFRITLPSGACCLAVTLGGRITADTAPLLRRFYGQPLGNLLRWVRDKRGTVEELA